MGSEQFEVSVMGDQQSQRSDEWKGCCVYYVRRQCDDFKIIRRQSFVVSASLPLLTPPTPKTANEEIRLLHKHRPWGRYKPVLPDILPPNLFNSRCIPGRSRSPRAPFDRRPNIRMPESFHVPAYRMAEVGEQTEAHQPYRREHRGFLRWWEGAHKRG